MAEGSIKRIQVVKVTGAEGLIFPDVLAVEEPLEIRLDYGLPGERKVQNISVTMRTPGQDDELATGFLFTENIIKNKEDIASVEYCFIACAENKENVIQVSLREGVEPELRNTERNFYTTSSCGVCGKGSIGALRTVSAVKQKDDKFFINPEILYGLPDTLQQHQQVFADTGGLHASALFDKNGELLLAREDVGRHNALDKLIGASIAKGWLPLGQNILLLSGRASFELVQKAIMAGINIIASVGAPSSLAVELAEEFNITLAGFLRGRRFNIYSGPNRIILPANEVTY